MASIAGKDKNSLYVRVGLPNRPDVIKQIPRVRMTAETIDKVFQSKVYFLQDDNTGEVLFPDDWRFHCMPPPTLYLVRERPAPKLDPDALEEDDYRGETEIFLSNVPEEMDKTSLARWFACGLDDDDPTLSRALLRLEDSKTQLATVNAELKLLPTKRYPGMTVKQAREAMLQRREHLMDQKKELGEAIVELGGLLAEVDGKRERADTTDFTLTHVEQVQPHKLNIWHARFNNTPYGRLQAYLAAHKTDWAEILVAKHIYGSKPALVAKGDLPDTGKAFQPVNMRDVLVRRLRHGDGMYVFGDERGYYSGEWKRNLRHGLGISIDALGRTTGRFVDDWVRGRAARRCACGDDITATFGMEPTRNRASLLHGHEYCDGVLHGKADIKFVDGSTFSGEFRNGVVHGSGEYKTSYGTSLQGEFDRFGTLHGRGVSVVGDSISVGHWRRGQQHGPGATIDNSIGRHDGWYRAGFADGIGDLRSKLIDANFHGSFVMGSRTGIGEMNFGNTKRDDERAERRDELVAAAAAGLRGPAREVAQELARTVANKALGVHSAADETFKKEFRNRIRYVGESTVPQWAGVRGVRTGAAEHILGSPKPLPAGAEEVRFGTGTYSAELHLPSPNRRTLRDDPETLVRAAVAHLRTGVDTDLVAAVQHLPEAYHVEAAQLVGDYMACLPRRAQRKAGVRQLVEAARRRAGVRSATAAATGFGAAVHAKAAEAAAARRRAGVAPSAPVPTGASAAPSGLLAGSAATAATGVVAQASIATAATAATAAAGGAGTGDPTNDERLELADLPPEGGEAEEGGKEEGPSTPRRQTSAQAARAEGERLAGAPARVAHMLMFDDPIHQADGVFVSSVTTDEERRQKEAAWEDPNEYNRPNDVVSIKYAGDYLVSNRWRASRPWDGAVLTERSGSRQPHTHRRWPLSSLSSRRVADPKVISLHADEDAILQRRRQVLRETKRSQLASRLQQEARNLGSFAYWQAQASKRLGMLRRKTRSLKPHLRAIQKDVHTRDEEHLLEQERRKAEERERAAAAAAAAAAASPAGGDGDNDEGREREP